MKKIVIFLLLMSLSEAIAQVTPNSPVISSSSTLGCYESTVTFTSTGCEAPNVVKWYYNNSFINNGVNLNQTFYETNTATRNISAKCVNGTLESPSSNIIVMNVGYKASTVYNVNVSASSILPGESTTLYAYGCNSSETYEWDNGLGSGGSKTVMPAATTTYSVNCKTSIGCVSPAFSKTIVVNKIKIENNTPAVSCPGIILPVTYTPLETFPNPTYNIKFYKREAGFSCGVGETELSSQTSTSSPFNFNLPTGLAPTGQIGTCSSPYSGTVPQYVDYYFKVYNGTELSNTYPVTISDCRPVKDLIMVFNICENVSSNASFTPTGINAGNVYNLELSNLGSNTYPTTPNVIASLTSNTATSIPFTMPSGTAFGQYYLKLSSTNPVGSTIAFFNYKSSSLTLSAPTAVTKSPSTTVLANSYVTLSASCAVETPDWYLPNGTLYNSGSSIQVYVQSTTTYTVKCSNGCSASTGVNITVDVMTPPTISASKTTVCRAEEFTLSASGCPSTSTVYWKAGNGNYFGTGATINYYVFASDNVTATCKAGSLETTASNALAITMLAPPVNATVSSSPSGTVLQNTNVVLTAVCPAGNTYSWDFDNNSTTNPRNYVATENKTFYVHCVQGLCKSVSAVNVTVNISLLAPTISAATASICSGTAASLSSTGCASPNTLTWYNASTNANLGIGLTLNPTITSSTSYYAKCSNGTTVSANSNTLNITVIPTPSAPSISQNPAGDVTANTSVTLNATCAAGNTVKWEDNSTANPRVVSVTASTTYTAKCVNAGCESAATTRTINVISQLPAPAISTTNSSVCSDYYATITALGNNCVAPNSIKWFQSIDGSNYDYVDDGLNFSSGYSWQSVSEVKIYAKCINSNYNAASESLASNILTFTKRPTPSFPTFSFSPAISTSNLTTSLTGTCISPSVLKWTNISPIPASNSIDINVNNANLFYSAKCESEFGCLSYDIKYKIEIPVIISEANALNGTFQLGNGKYTWGGSSSNGGENDAVSDFAQPNYHTGNFDEGSFFFSSIIGTPVNYGFQFNALFKKKNVWLLNQFQEVQYISLLSSAFESKFKYDASIPPCSILTKTGSTVNLSGFCLNIGQNITDITVPAQVCEAQNMPFSITTTSPASSYLIELLYDAKFQYGCGGPGNEGTSVIASKTINSTSGTILIPEILRNSGNTSEGGCGQTRTDGYRLRITPIGSTEGISVDIPQMFMLASCPPPCPSSLSLASTIDDISVGTITKQANSTTGKITATNKITGTANVTYQAKSIELNEGFKANNGTVFKAEVGGCN